MAHVKQVLADCFGVVVAISVVVILSSQVLAQDTSQPTAKAIFSAAFKLYQSGQFEAAVVAFERGLAQSPRDAQAHYYLAESLERVGRENVALEHFEKAAELAPASDEGILAAAKLPGLRTKLTSKTRQQQIMAIANLQKADDGWEEHHMNTSKSGRTTQIDFRHRVGPMQELEPCVVKWSIKQEQVGSRGQTLDSEEAVATVPLRILDPARISMAHGKYGQCGSALCQYGFVVTIPTINDKNAVTVRYVHWDSDLGEDVTAGTNPDAQILMSNEAAAREIATRMRAAIEACATR